MASLVYLSLTYLVLFVCLISIPLDGEAKGVRVSGVRRSSTRVRTGTSYRNRYGSFVNWKTAAVAGAFFGYSRYTTRRRYYDHPDNEPSICRNIYDYKMDNGTAYEWFICPMYAQDETHTYCCGPGDRQRCCDFWDDSGRVAGVVIGILLLFGLIGIAVYCCCCRRSGREGIILKKKHVPQTMTQGYQMAATQPAASSVASSYPPQPAPGGYPPPQPAPGGYPPQPAPGGYPPPQPAPGGYPPQPAPGGYPPQPSAGGYPPQPAPGGYPPQPAPEGYPPQPAPGGYPPPQPAPGYPPMDAGYPPAGQEKMPSAPPPSYPGGPFAGQ